MRAFIEHHFDKLLLTGVLLYMIHIVVFMSLYQFAAENVSWARELTAGIGGALLGLITGRRNTDTNQTANVIQNNVEEPKP